MDSSARRMILTLRWIWMIFFGICMLIFLLGFIITGIKRNWQFPTAKIDEFSVCDISDTKSGSNVKVTVCGNLTTDGVAILDIDIYQLPEKTVVARNDAGDEFTRGYFSRILILPVDSQPGKYEVIVRFKREIIATIIATKEFELK